MTNNVMLTVGLGPDSTIVIGVIADGSVVCNLILNKQAIKNHIAVLQRHVDVLPDEVIAENHFQVN